MLRLYRPSDTSGARPIRASFLITSMPIGGAETLLVNLLKGMNTERIVPEILCLKEPGPLGERIQREIPLRHGFLWSKYDISVLWKLAKHFQRHRTDAIVTVGAGDKMFWGRLAGKLAGVPVITSAIHSTGWPDGIGRCNRWLTPITDSIIAVAKSHAEFLVEHERFPREKVVVIPNGVDTKRFQPTTYGRERIRRELNIPMSSDVVGIVAALRPEKNHALFVEVAAQLCRTRAETHFIVVGDGPCRPAIEAQIAELGLGNRFHLLGSRHDTQDILSAMDVFALTSHNEASPVSILEALATEVPVVATDVGSIHETVEIGRTGYLVKAGDAVGMAGRIAKLLDDPSAAEKIGVQGRQMVIQRASLESMVLAYEELLCGLYDRKTGNGDPKTGAESSSPLLANGAILDHPFQGEPSSECVEMA